MDTKYTCSNCVYYGSSQTASGICKNVPNIDVPKLPSDFCGQHDQFQKDYFGISGGSGGGSVAGPEGAVQINSSDQHGFDPNLIFETTTDTLYSPFFNGDGSELINLNSTNINGMIPLNLLGTGTPSSNTFLRGDKTWSTITIPSPGGNNGQIQINIGGIFSGDPGLTWSSSTLNATNLAGKGAGITALNANNLASGSVGTARLGSGTANATSFLRGDQTWSPVFQKEYYFIVGNISVGTDKTPWTIFNQNRIITKVQAIAKTAPSGVSIIIDILSSTDGGNTWISLWNITPANRPTIPSNAKIGPSVTSFDNTNMSVGTILRVDIIQVGTTVNGKDLTVTLQYY
jgi:hypothetical protein